jgi:choline dehydrogenase-like flavoprotein
VSEADIAIVGSGATGTLLAARLAAKGHKVVILEGGPNRALSDLVSSTVWSRRLKWGGSPVRVAGKDPVAFPFEAGWGRGGSALHHYACWFRLHREDFAVASLHGAGLDWPMRYEDLRPYYDALQAEIGISGDAQLEVWRPPGDPYPMPPQPIFRQGKLIAHGFEKRGQRVAPLPMAINSVAFNGRPACIQDGWCDAGCPTGALANPIAIYGETLQSHGVETLYDASVLRIITGASGKRAQAVEYVNGQGQRRTLHAKAIILAAFAVQNPRLLLNSANAQHPDGLANSSGLVGHYLMSHGAVSLYGMFNEPTDNHLGRTGGQLFSQDSYRTGTPGPYKPGYTFRIGNALKLADIGGIANARVDLCGAALTEFMRKAALNLGTMSALCDSLPAVANRVELSPEKDRHDAPLARVVHSLSDDTRGAIAAATEEGKQLLSAAGAHEVWAAPPRTEHLMGGTVMGKDPARSVANAYGQTHDVENLFIAGPGLFPTCGAVNPTFTALALAARSADYILAEWSGLRQAA